MTSIALITAWATPSNIDNTKTKTTIVEPTNIKKYGLAQLHESCDINNGCTVLETSDTIKPLAEHLEKLIILAIKRNRRQHWNKPRYILYQTYEVDANLTSLITNDLKIKTWTKYKTLCRSWKLYVHWTNDKNFRDEINDCFKYIPSYLKKMRRILELPNDKLAEAYENILGKKPNFFFSKRAKMLRDIIRYSQDKLVENYA